MAAVCGAALLTVREEYQDPGGARWGCGVWYRGLGALPRLLSQLYITRGVKPCGNGGVARIADDGGAARYVVSGIAMLETGQSR